MYSKNYHCNARVDSTSAQIIGNGMLPKDSLPEKGGSRKHHTFGGAALDTKKVLLDCQQEHCSFNDVSPMPSSCAITK